jgi:hypothetical protein
MLVNAKLPTSLGEGGALLATRHIHNKIPSEKFKVSPYKL